MERLIFHVDVNSAFLSWSAAELLRQNPEAEDLRNTFAAVGGDRATRKGIILAKSIAAKKCGVTTGEPVAQALKKCPSLKLVSPDFRIYNRNSKALMAILQEYAPVVEQFSIDEAFLDMTGTGRLYPDPVRTAEEIKNRIKEELGFTVNVGIAPNKLLAKMASDFAKPDKVHTLFRNEVPVKMWPLPVRELFCVGKSTADKLNRMGITTIGELAAARRDVLTAAFGPKQSRMLLDYSNGRDDSPVGGEEPAEKSYGNSTTLPYDYESEKEVLPVLLALSDSVASRLRADRVMATSVAVTIKDNSFRTISHQTQLSEQTDITDVIYQTACRLFREVWDKETPIRLLGVTAGKVGEEETFRQMSLFDFDDTNREKAKSLDHMVDQIRGRYGSGMLKRASLMKSGVAEGIGKKQKGEKR